MNRSALCIVAGMALPIVALLSGCCTPRAASETPAHSTGETPMQLGNFSVSLSVKDLKTSVAFYEKLGFRPVGGDGKAYSIMQNQTSTIGLFQGMFTGNLLTFNPGWDRACSTLPEFDDVRDIQRTLTREGITLTSTVDEASTGPASITLTDPDGNVILIDQHVPRPGQPRSMP